MKADQLPDRIDFGPGRWIIFAVGEDDDVIGAFEVHPAMRDTETAKEGSRCEGFIHFDVPGNYGKPAWTVEDWDPLTLSPSVLCRACGNHGFIREGEWVLA